jgi:hypothetical protein
VNSKRLGAVLIGLIAAWIVGNVLNLGVLSVVYLLGRASSGADALMAFHGSTMQWALGLVTGGLALGTGGFASTWIARDERLGAALTFGSVYLLLQSVNGFFRPPVAPWWMSAAYLVLIVPSAVAGGYLALGRAARPRPSDGVPCEQ